MAINKEKIKAFIVYLVREPYIQLKDIFSMIPKTLLKTRIWMIMFSVFLLVTIILDYKFGQIISYIVLVILFLRYTWEQGDFWHDYKQRKYGNLIKKQSHDTSHLNNGPDQNIK